MQPQYEGDLSSEKKVKASKGGWQGVPKSWQGGFLRLGGICIKRNGRLIIRVLLFFFDFLLSTILFSFQFFFSLSIGGFAMRIFFFFYEVKYLQDPIFIFFLSLPFIAKLRSFSCDFNKGI